MTMCLKKTMIKKVLLIAILMMTVLFSSNTESHMTVKAATKSEVEENDSYTDANVVVLGNSVSGTISDSRDVDYYKLTPTSNGKIELNFCHTYEDSEAGWNVYTYIYENGEYTQLSSQNVRLNDGEKKAIPYIGVVKNGVYYVIVERYGYNDEVVGKNYKIETKFEMSNYYERETNDKYASATIMEMNQSYCGNINASSDKDYYRLKASQNGKIELNFCHTYEDSEASWNVYTYIYENGEYTQLSSQNVRLNAGEKKAIPYIGVVKNGVYYVIVERYGYNDEVVGQNYKIEIKFNPSNYYERETNDAYVSATEIKQNQSYKGVINNQSDKDYFKLIAPENGKISLKFSHAYNDVGDYWNVRVYQYVGGQYIELKQENICINSNKATAFPMIEVVRNGIYYVKIERGTYLDDIIGENYILNARFFIKSPISIQTIVKKNKVTLTWSKINDVTGYEIYYRKGKKGEFKKLKTTVKTKYTYKKLGKGTRYYFKVRAYKQVDNNIYYSAYTSVKSVKYK